ncbi:hypothetical protein [Kurthia gibsonii]|uniref:hypothetical protein n=1 Tax=Kurthia gibsonii TaxID=33946 RepID=UPI003018B159
MEVILVRNFANQDGDLEPVDYKNKRVSVKLIRPMVGIKDIFVSKGDNVIFDRKKPLMNGEVISVERDFEEGVLYLHLKKHKFVGNEDVVIDEVNELLNDGWKHSE